MPKAYPIVIWDENRRIAGRTTSDSVLESLAQNNVKIFPEDITAKELILDPVAHQAAGESITIKRAPTITVKADGQTLILKSWKKTVGEVLAEKNFLLGPKDIVEPSKGTVVGNGAFVTVTRINEVEDEKEVPIPFSTSTQKDYWVPAGQTKILKRGVKGSKLQVYKVVYRNGVEVSRQLLKEQTTLAPIAEVVARGVKPSGDKYNRWPVLVAAGTRYGVAPEEMYKVMACESKGYQYADSGTHKGIFQWDGSFYSWATKAGYAGADIFDVTAQANATALRVSKSGWSAWGCKP